ncbi:hypothetical protein [Spiroplasma ixodetis]|uniref:Lipoprotein n=1 Tax=Spiroplasma ixodetis TaxID=2141 RepID=A0ABM8BZ20_9MOLU|nr:hypothetical protein [Spiroplasma ixodetis]BDT05148.1 hypothetical protein SHM_27940 [Spiroplasma ixodetis]
MRKLITLFSTLSLLSSSVSTIVACGTGDGSKIETNFKNEPSNKDGDPLVDYVYNKYYQYDTKLLYKPLTAFMQLAADKIRIDRNALEVTDAARDFYNSDQYKSGNYESINYNVNNDPNKVMNEPFSCKDANGSLLVFGLTDNDISKQQYYGYWYVTYETATEAENPSKVAKTSIVSPKITDFKDDKNKTIIKKGWIHLFFIMKDSKMNKTFKIDFNIQIDVSFSLWVDKNKKEIVVINPNTIDKALGDVDFRNPDKVVHERINNMTFSES